jgi:precorrin-2/cobalt-factor-2 C20-methyltransferase
MTEQKGVFYGVGVGPGDPELLTVKALRLLQTAPVVAFPAGVQGRLGFAEQIIQAYLGPEQHRLPLHFPYVQDEAVLTQAWELAADQVWECLAQGKDVVFASEGDVSFYSTFAYLADTLRSRHPAVQITAIPGVCSPLAAAAAIAHPLTLRQQRLLILPALYNLADLETTLAIVDVLVLMKVSSVYPQVWALLKQHQLLEHSYVVEWATLPQQQIYQDLQNHPNLQLHYFSLLVVQRGNGGWGIGEGR